MSGDRVGEETELFFVNLSNPAFANIANPKAVGTILDDEPYVSLAYFSDPATVEGNAGTTPKTFRVELSAASDAPVTVGFSTVDGSALAGSDYQAASGTVTFAPGQVTQTLIVQVIGDTQAEDDEYFYVNLSAPTNAKLGTGYNIGYIADNDRPPTIAISDNRGTSTPTSMMLDAGQASVGAGLGTGARREGTHRATLLGSRLRQDRRRTRRVPTMRTASPGSRRTSQSVPRPTTS